MKKSLIVLQDGYKECGSACLLSIIRYYHGNISMSRLVELTNTTMEGTNFYNLKIAASSLGLDSAGYQVEDINFLKEINKPFICQFIYCNREHFVVVYGLRRNKVVVMDPSVGERIINIDEFKECWTGYIMIFSPVKKLIQYKENKYLNQIICRVLNQNKRIVFDIILLAVIFMVVSFIYTLYFEVMLDKVIYTTSYHLLIVTFFFTILLLVKCVTSFFRNELLIILNQKLDCSILLDTFQKILLLPYNYYKNRTTGEIVSRINDLIYVKNVLNKIILTVCLDFIILISFSVVIMIRYFQLFIFLMLIILIYVVLFYVFRSRLKRCTEISQEDSAKLNSYLIETISGYETVKNIHLESIVKSRLDHLYITSLHHHFIYENFGNLELFLKDLISYLGLLLIQFLGFSLVMKGSMSIGTLLTFTFLSNYVLDPVRNILDLNKEYFYIVNSIKRVNHLFEVDDEDFNKNTHYSVNRDISVKNLFFGYRDEENILNDVSFHINYGEKVMIVGSSGSGKSTILKLFLKYYLPKRDVIYFGDTDINDFSISNVREEVSCMFHNEIIYNDTIKNNIIFNRKVSDAEFQDIVRITCVDDIVKTMFLGYDTRLEENGCNLSGGQRQRIILARMLLKPSNMILIDEGLNAMDVNLERKILKNLFYKYRNKTIIIVSHRVENLDLFDHFIRLSSGHVVEDVCKIKGDIS